MNTTERYTGRARGRSPDVAANPQANGGAGTVGGQDFFEVPITSPTGALAAELVRLSDQLSERDLTVLHALAALRLMTGHQIRRLVFDTGSPQTRALRARRCLLRLHRLGLVVRGDRQVGGPRAGSTSYPYRLSGSGHRLSGARPAPPPRPMHAAHVLAVSELAVCLYEAHRAGTLELLHFAAEPACWRSFTVDGARRYLRPDAFLIVAVGDWEHLWFVELDRGTQAVSTVCRKVRAYYAYAATGQEQARWGVFPRVAYLAINPVRRDALNRAIGRAIAHTPDTDALVTVAQLPDAVSVLAAFRPTGRFDCPDAEKRFP
jgi:hypothetical protein